MLMTGQMPGASTCLIAPLVLTAAAPQESLAKSMAECADTYRMKQLPKLKQDLAAELPAVLQQVQQSQ